MKIQQFDLDAGSLGGVIHLLRPVPSEVREGPNLLIDPWGELAPLRLVPEFAVLIPIVTGEAMSHALHGWMRPLVEALGIEPRYQLLRIPDPHNVCSLAGSCMMHDSKRCHPRHKKLPECWLPEGVPEARRAMAVVTQAWVEDRYVVIVEGAEFVIGRSR